MEICKREKTNMDGKPPRFFIDSPVSPPVSGPAVCFFSFLSLLPSWKEPFSRSLSASYTAVSPQMRHWVRSMGLAVLLQQWTDFFCPQLVPCRPLQRINWKGRLEFAAPMGNSSIRFSISCSKPTTWSDIVANYGAQNPQKIEEGKKLDVDRSEIHLKVKALGS